MKISDLKQPYRRMAEYLVTQHCIQQSSDGIYNFYKQGGVMDLFCNSVDKGNHPEITPEIKKNFPADFDFSGEKVEDERRYKFAFKNNMEEKYTQLAKEGRFNELPATCEFSEPVELEVWDDDGDYLDKLEISGKYKGFFVDDSSNGLYSAYQHAQLPTKKIDFTQFKTGDIVEVETKSHGTYYGIISEIIKDFIKLSPDDKFMTNTHIKKELIETITKLK